MDWLAHNPIADMPGSLFLVFYALVIAMTLIACRLRSRGAGRLNLYDLAPVPTRPDPYEIAYLRGGADEVARVLVCELLHCRHLRYVDEDPIPLARREPEPRIEQTPGAVTEALSALEQTALRYFAVPRRMRDTVAARGLRNVIASFCHDYHERLAAEGMLAPFEAGRTNVRAMLTGAAVIMVVGGYKLAIALSRGRTNVGFLILMALAALVILAFVCRRRRLTPHGAAHLERLQMAFAKLRGPSTSSAAVGQPAVQAAASAGADFTWPLLFALYGDSVLGGSPYEMNASLWRHERERAGLSTASSCGAAGGCGSLTDTTGSGSDASSTAPADSGSSCSAGSGCASAGGCGGGGGGCGGCGGGGD